MFQPIARVLITSVLAVVALIIHELAHIFAVRYFGGRIQRVRFFPLGITARFYGLEKMQAWERYTVYAAGAIANIATAAWVMTVSHLSYFGIPLLEQFAIYNIALAIFNLLPILPLDGGRILHQWVSNRRGILPATRIMLKISLYASVVLAALGVLQILLYSFNFTLICAALYIRYKCKQLPPTLHMDFYNFINAKKAPARRRLLPVRHTTIDEKTTVREALATITMDYTSVFINNKNQHAHITEDMLVSYFLAHGPSRAPLVSLLHSFKPEPL